MYIHTHSLRDPGAVRVQKKRYCGHRRLCVFNQLLKPSVEMCSMDPISAHPTDTTPTVNAKAVSLLKSKP